MDITAIASSFAHDDQVKLVVSLIAADFVLGVLAAIYTHTFRLTYVANFARNDLLAKVVPWFAVFVLDKTSHSAGIVGPVDWSMANNVAFGLVTLAMAGSILKSLADFGVNLPPAVGGSPPPPPPAA